MAAKRREPSRPTIREVELHRQLKAALAAFGVKHGNDTAVSFLAVHLALVHTEATNVRRLITRLASMHAADRERAAKVCVELSVRMKELNYDIQEIMPKLDDLAEELYGPDEPTREPG